VNCIFVPSAEVEGFSD